MDAPLAPEEVRLALEEFARAFRRPMDEFRRALVGLEENKADPETARSMAFLCEDARALPERFREYALAIHGDRPLSPAPMDLAGLLAEVERRVGPEARSRSQDFACEPGGSREVVVADLESCVDVLSRLARNAVLYAPPGSKVRVTAGRAGQGWRMAVSDDGPGVPAKLRHRLFEPFERLSRDVQDQVPGAGLGLALCRALVERMGGTISLDCPPEGGTVVTVELPMDAQSA